MCWGTSGCLAGDSDAESTWTAPCQCCTSLWRWTEGTSPWRIKSCGNSKRGHGSSKARTSLSPAPKLAKWPSLPQRARRKAGIAQDHLVGGFFSPPIWKNILVRLDPATPRIGVKIRKMFEVWPSHPGRRNWSPWSADSARRPKRIWRDLSSLLARAPRKSHVLKPEKRGNMAMENPPCLYGGPFQCSGFPLLCVYQRLTLKETNLH